MLDTYLQLFYTTSEKLIPLIPVVFGVYLIIKLTSDLLFKD
jgi:hypothetical protein